MFYGFFCDTLNGLDCFDFTGDQNYGPRDSTHWKAPDPGVEVTREVTIQRQTDKAVLVSRVVKPEKRSAWNVHTGWYPKSEVSISRDEDGKTWITIPSWLVTAKRRDQVIDPMEGFEAL